MPHRVLPFSQPPAQLVGVIKTMKLLHYYVAVLCLLVTKNAFTDPMAEVEKLAADRRVLKMHRAPREGE